VALGNERMTAAAGVILLILLAVEGVTIVFLRQLMSVHLFVGALLIPPMLVKLGSTGYRFARYYTGDAVYRAKGPPHPLLRAIGPLVVLTTLLVLASGITLMVAGPSAKNTLLPIHKVSFIVWLVFMGVHVMGHLLEVPSAVRADLTRAADVPGRSLRWLLLGVALGGGAGLGAWALSYAGPWLSTF